MAKLTGPLLASSVILGAPLCRAGSIASYLHHTYSFKSGVSGIFRRFQDVRTPNSLSGRGKITFGNCGEGTRRRFQRKEMSEKTLVIGVSGVTGGGKTTLTKLLRRTFPWARVIYQDHYFYDDDYEGHVRLPEVDNHVNYELLRALDMDKMCSDVEAVLKGIDEGKLELRTDAPNDTGDDLLSVVKPFDCDLSPYKKIPIVIIEGFTIFGLDYLTNSCDLRFFVKLDEDECRRRRDTRNYDPPDCPGYFEKCVWPEYIQHFQDFIVKQSIPSGGAGDSGKIHVFDGAAPIQDIWDRIFALVKDALEKTT